MVPDTTSKKYGAPTAKHGRTEIPGRIATAPVTILLIFLTAVLFLLSCSKDNGRSKPMSYDKAALKVIGLAEKTDWKENIVSRRAKIDLVQKTDLRETLPDIDKFEMTVSPASSRGNQTVVEIFASPHLVGKKNTDGWLRTIAREFNNKNIRLKNGRAAKVAIRNIPSGTAYQFITSGKHVPHGYIPSNHIWIEMIRAQGINTRPINEKFLGNIAGVVMKKEAADNIRAIAGTLDIQSIVGEVVHGNLAMGYTNPFASSTGLNFLISVLTTFSNGEHGKMLSPEVASSFSSFQQGVPYIALTTIQMRESVTKSGSLDAFVMEYQSFKKTPALQTGYEFIPYGIRHNNPLFAIGNLANDQIETLEALAEFAAQPRFKAMAKELGFNPELSYEPTSTLPNGSILIRAQQLWKDNKNSGRPMVAMFLIDTSGSMAGARLKALKQALVSGSEFITSENLIGLLTFDSTVKLLLPIKKFTLLQKASFIAAAEDLEVGGNTSLYDGIIVALSHIVIEKDNHPEAKPILFVLTDGQPTDGLKFEEVSEIIESLEIPIYTIGYEANVVELAKLSTLVEAASINAMKEDISYKIGALLNAQM